jgi:hypothetical protein
MLVARQDKERDMLANFYWPGRPWQLSRNNGEKNSVSARPALEYR